MKDNDVAFFVEQYELTKEIVEASIEDGTLSQRIKDATKTPHASYETEADFDSFKAKHKTQIETSYFSDLVEKAKKGDIPQDLHSPIKGAALQQFSREAAKKHGVETYTDVNDLIDQIVKTSANGKGDPQLLADNDQLKKRNLELGEEKDNAINSVRNEYKGKFLDRYDSEMLNKVPHDFSSIKPDELNTFRESTKKVLQDVFKARYTLDQDDKGREVVLKDNVLLTNDKTFDPVPLLDVYIGLAKEIGQKLKSPDTGGQGGSSSSNTDLPFTNGESFAKYCADNNIQPTSAEGIKLWGDSGLKE